MEQGLDIRTGWHPGLIGAIAAEHGRYYPAVLGFGRRFEAIVAHELGAYFVRMAEPDRTWSAWDGDDFVASVTLDFHDPAAPGLARLRWFIATRRGTGLGRRLMAAAVDHLDRQGAGCTLETVVGLDAALRLYQDFGFVRTLSEKTDRWGPDVTALTLDRAGRAAP